MTGYFKYELSNIINDGKLRTREIERVNGAIIGKNGSNKRLVLNYKIKVSIIYYRINELYYDLNLRWILYKAIDR